MRLVVIIFVVSLKLSSSFAQEDCSLRKDDADVFVYLCENEQSDFKTIIVELEVPATVSQYAAHVLDIDNYSSWQYRVSKQEVLKKISDTELFYYSEVSAPWPAANRDYVFHLKMEQDSITKVLKLWLSSVPDYIAEKDGIVRVPYAESLLTLTPITADTVSVRFEMDINPGGELPIWIVNMLAANAPWNTYNNLREQLINQGSERKEVDFILNY